jgi:regulator of nucleoside diphosphate kinase
MACSRRKTKKNQSPVDQISTRSQRSFFSLGTDVARLPVGHVSICLTWLPVFFAGREKNRVGYFKESIKGSFMRHSEKTVTECDLQRLRAFMDWMNNEKGIDALQEELAGVKVISQYDVSPDVVTMNSVVVLKDEISACEFELELVYPNHADSTQGKISILSPMGTVLLGMKAGRKIHWPTSNGVCRKLKVLSVRYQPEADGKYEL